MAFFLQFKFKALAYALLLWLTLSSNASATEIAAAPTKEWTSASLRNALNHLPTGDAKRGQLVHEKMFCSSCHGPIGVAPTQNWPHLAGQKAAYVAKLMLDYQDKRMTSNKGAELMHDIAVMMTPQQISDVAEFYAQQQAALDDGTPRPAADLNVTQLVRKGDPKRLITPCASCHGTRGQGGKLEAPALAGQNPLYFVRSMLDYQNGHRTNDVAKGMRTFAKNLTRSEIEALATYYADLPKKR